MRRSVVIALIAGSLLLTVAGAGDAKSLLRAELTLVAGENPSASAALPAEGAAQWDGRFVRVAIGNMDPARFGPGCRAEMRAGVLAARGLRLITGVADETPVAMLTFEQPGVVGAGNEIEVRVRCERDGGTRETRWLGFFV